MTLSEALPGVGPLPSSRICSKGRGGGGACASGSWPPGSASTPRRSGTRADRVDPPAPRTPGDYRDYAEADAARLAFVKTAQRLGLSLDEVAEVLALRERGEAPCAYVRDVVDKQFGSIDRRIAELPALHPELRAEADFIPEADGDVTPDPAHQQAGKAPVGAPVGD